MMQESRVLTMTYTKLKNDPTNFQNSLMLKNLNLEELVKLLIVPLLNWLEQKMIILGLWLKPKHFKETWTDNSPKNPTFREMLKPKTLETESSNLHYSKEKPNTET